MARAFDTFARGSRALAARFRRDERGGVGITFALAGSAVIALSIAAVDHGMRASTHAELQSVVDGAALAGARHLVAGATTDSARVRARIDTETRRLVEANMTRALGNDAQLIGFKTDIDFDRSLVSVTMSVDKRGLAPFTFHQVDRTLSARSAASRRLEQKPLCALALGTDTERGIRFVGDAPLAMRDCVFWSNSRSRTSIALADRARANAERFCAAGGVGEDTAGRLAPEPELNCERREDPLRAWHMPRGGECGRADAIQGGRATIELEPGVHCSGVVLDADRVTLRPGVHVVRGGSFVIRAGSRLVAEGVTILLASDVRSIAIQVQGDAVLSAPTTGPHAGLFMAQEAGAATRQSAGVHVRGQTRLSGIVYLPDRDVAVLGQGDPRAPRLASIIGHTVPLGGAYAIEGRDEPEVTRRPGFLVAGLAIPILRR